MLCLGARNAHSLLKRRKEEGEEEGGGGGGREGGGGRREEREEGGGGGGGEDDGCSRLRVNVLGNDPLATLLLTNWSSACGWGGWNIRIP